MPQLFDFDALMKRAIDLIRLANRTNDQIARERFLDEAEQLLSKAEEISGLAPPSVQQETVH